MSDATSFSTLGLPAALLENLSSLGYVSMTPIQAQSLPHILAGKDVIAQGETGSGKTAAFGLGLLQTLDAKQFVVQALVICPTRELADQVAQSIRELARATQNVKVLAVCGGSPFRAQANSLTHGAHIVVGTPGRIGDHLRKRTLQLSHLLTLVLDEADRMLDMGFQAALDEIVAQLPVQRQTLLFSATFPPQITGISKSIMRDPVMVMTPREQTETNIEQHYYRVDNDEARITALRLLLLQWHPESSLVFCNTRRETVAVADALRDAGFSALALHGELEQRERTQGLVRFANRSVSVLVATDVAARGLDIDGLDAVFNYQLARDTEVHVHRVGRTGRAGKHGIAGTLFCGREQYHLDKLQAYLGSVIESEPLPPMRLLTEAAFAPSMVAIHIDGGKKQKLRAGDILGALTGAGGVDGKQVGKIHIFDQHAYVAVHTASVEPALRKLAGGKLKGRNFRIRRLRA